MTPERIYWESTMHEVLDAAVYVRQQAGARGYHDLIDLLDQLIDIINFHKHAIGDKHENR